MLSRAVVRAESAPWIDDEASIARTVNVQVESIFVEVVTVVDAELARWIQGRDCRHAPSAAEKDLADRYERHGGAVLAALDHGLNRFLSFVRVEKGQYGVRHLNLDRGRLASHATAFHAQAKADDSEWFEWCPTHVISLVAIGPDKNDPRFLRPPDWPSVQAFVASNTKPTLTLELLAGADALAEEGSDRAALTEGVAALEVALARFVRSSRLADALLVSVRSRLSIAALPRLADRMGLTGSVAVLLPFLFPADRLPADLSATCTDAIAERQTVIHQGQREVDSHRLRKHLHALR